MRLKGGHVKPILLALVASVACVLTPVSQASTLTSIIDRTYSGGFPATISGTLSDQDDVLLETLTLKSLSDLTITTDSYATGGFEPSIELFNSSGDFLDAGLPAGVADPATRIIGDTSLTALDIPGGTYTLALSDFLVGQPLTATNLSDGFSDFSTESPTKFVDADGNARTGNYSLTIKASAVPEPSLVWLSSFLFLALAIRAGKGYRRNA
jgi:hypothetical protein